MRQIKCRAWDKIHKQWWYCELPNGSFLNELALEGNKKQPFKDTDLEPWCQYTGLKDKNGKEIYERDILSPHNRVVEFHTDVRLKSQYECYGGAGFYTRAHKGLTRPEELGIFSFGVTQAEVSEIIGNICSNPELLEAK